MLVLTDIPHSLHNYSACEFLLESGKYNDWVITTAFYSALHMMREDIFPMNFEGNNYDNFDEYCNNFRKEGKHQLMIKVVEYKIKEAAPSYRWLFDVCMTARYKNYRVKNKKAQMAKSHLDRLKKIVEATKNS